MKRCRIIGAVRSGKDVLEYLWIQYVCYIYTYIYIFIHIHIHIHNIYIPYIYIHTISISLNIFGELSTSWGTASRRPWCRRHRQKGAWFQPPFVLDWGTPIGSCARVRTSSNFDFSFADLHFWWASHIGSWLDHAQKIPFRWLQYANHWDLGLFLAVLQAVADSNGVPRSSAQDDPSIPCLTVTGGEMHGNGNDVLQGWCP